jgi:hypothetical protein
LNQNRALIFWFEAFSSREPVSTSLENALKENPLQKKKEQGEKPCSKNCVDPISPQNWI